MLLPQSIYNLLLPECLLGLSLGLSPKYVPFTAAECLLGLSLGLSPKYVPFTAAECLLGLSLGLTLQCVHFKCIFMCSYCKKLLVKILVC